MFSWFSIYLHDFKDRVYFIPSRFHFLTRNYCDNWIWQHFDEIASRMQCQAGQTQAKNGQHIHSFRKNTENCTMVLVVDFFGVFLVFTMFILKWHTCGAMGRCLPMLGCSTSAVASCDLDATAGVGFGTRTTCPKLSFPW